MIIHPKKGIYFREKVFLIMDEAHLLDPNSEQLLALLKKISTYSFGENDPFIIIMSATIQTEKYAKYFGTKYVIKVKGSTQKRKRIFPENEV